MLTLSGFGSHDIVGKDNFLWKFRAPTNRYYDIDFTAGPRNGQSLDGTFTVSFMQ
jgi:hypothetical protein